MSVFQVEEYYISITNVTVTLNNRTELLAMFAEENIDDFEIYEDGSSIVVDCFESVADADAIEEIINGILGIQSSTKYVDIL